MNEAIDPDGNVIRPGMTIVCHREVWTVTAMVADRLNLGLFVCHREVWTVTTIDGHNKFQLLITNHIQEDGQKNHLLIGHKRLQYVNIIRFQSPIITYP